jgi:hypothetical protein
MRATVRGVIVGGAFAACGVLLFVATPLLLHLSFAAGPYLATALGAVGFIAGVGSALARLKLPDMQDAALALEGRLTDDDAALATMLQMCPENRFEKPILQRASESLEAALRRPGPHVLRTRELLIAPFVGLVALTLLVWAFGVEIADTLPPRQTAPTSSAAFSLDIERDRTSDDRQAIARAMGLKVAAAELTQAAKAMRSEAQTQQERQAALDKARKAAASASDAEVRNAATALPELTPTDSEEREALAVRLENLASGAGRRAGATGGMSDSSGNGDPQTRESDRRFVPFPRLRLSTTASPVEHLAAQTPERRALAERAISELEKAR